MKPFRLHVPGLGLALALADALGLGLRPDWFLSSRAISASTSSFAGSPHTLPPGLAPAARQRQRQPEPQPRLRGAARAARSASQTSWRRTWSHSVVKAAFVEDAEPEAVSHAVRDVLERRGALVNEHLHSRVRFRGLQPEKHAWSRAGYVGIYQRTGERDVEVRLILRAQWPYRILVTVALLNVLGILTTIVLQPSGTVFFSVAFLAAFALLTAAILYVGTLKHVREEERALMEDFETEFHADVPGARVLDEEERELAELEAELDAEIERRRLAERRKREPKPARAKPAFPSFTLRPGAKKPKSTEPRAAVREASDEDLEARRARLLARKAELEAKRREIEQRESR